MTLSLIVAMDSQGTIGANGGLPWRLPADLRRFKAITMGHHLIMGRKTWDSLGRALPGRVSVVLTRQDAAKLPLPAGVLRATSLEEALRLAQAAGDVEPMVIGGAEAYALGLPLADRLHVTRVQAACPGDVRFPPVDWSAWRLAHAEDHPADPQHAHAYRFETYERIKAQ